MISSTCGINYQSASCFLPVAGGVALDESTAGAAMGYDVLPEVVDEVLRLGSRREGKMW
jgi:hypothetical protein